MREYTEGEDILLTCVVLNLGSHTVFWAKEGSSRRILTVNNIRLTSDTRYSVMHDDGESSFKLLLFIKLNKFSIKLLKYKPFMLVDFYNISKIQLGLPFLINCI